MIRIEIIEGHRYVQADDRDRAEEAAAKVLADAAANVAEAAAEYRRQWELYDDEAPMTGLARVWCDASRAADRALTEGWARPDGAPCTLDASE